jgi:hypothetical protein
MLLGNVQKVLVLVTLGIGSLIYAVYAESNHQPSFIGQKYLHTLQSELFPEGNGLASYFNNL